MSSTPEAERTVLVWNNLHTHSIGSLYEAFHPEEADQLASRFEFRHTPGHGPWLDATKVKVGCLIRHGLP